MLDFPFPPALRLLRWAIHGTFAVLLVIAVVQVAYEDRPAVAATGALLGLAYAVGLGIERRMPDFGGPVHLVLGRIWLSAITLGWVALALFAQEFVWLAFPLFFAYLHLLPLRAALPGLVVLTAFAIGSAGWHTGGLSPAVVVGPTIGAIVATLLALVYKTLYSESEQRRRLIDDLVSTREKLVLAERDAARLAERERLAREIHDTLAQGMSSIILLLRAAGRDLTVHPDAARAHIREAEQAAQENLEEARDFVRALAPPALQHSSLVAALSRISESAAARTPTKVRFEVSGDPVELPSDYDLALLRVAQGALGNVGRHSGAANARVTLSYLGDAVVLDVVDDGRGFDPDTPPGTGYGLRAMRERASALGGGLDVESVPGEGTAVALTLPLARPEVTR
ncbi:sensor histidine kinase [Sphaerisporangium fuscum]|uniref:sensor histidine kinase n=1 Tax=Sphaerisporangium fuscum TaxID=2835868 RepID=UPI001BDCEA9E|nr:sensor histidine kinase [Sphaerisporangium fuscum]